MAPQVSLAPSFLYLHLASITTLSRSLLGSPLWQALARPDSLTLQEVL